MRFSDLRKKDEEPGRAPGRRQEAAGQAPPHQAPLAPLPEAVPADPRAEAAAQPSAQPQLQAQPPQDKPRPSHPSRKQEEKKEPAMTAARYKALEKEAREVYSCLLSKTDSFLTAVDQPYCEKYYAVLLACGQIVSTLKTNPALVGFTSYSTADNYLRAHTANTAILSLAMGLEAGLPAEELELLGFCSMAHDIGMTDYAAMANSPERLDDHDCSELTLHSEAGAGKLDRIVDLDYKAKERARRVVMQIHERVDGTGYPGQLSSEEIDPLAQIIAIADAYEALTHPRSWREAYPPPDAVKELIEKEGRGFNARAVKLLIAVISIYPPGSLVALTTGETARVLMVNRGLLTRPVAEILLSPDDSLVEPRLADLKEHPLVAVERSVDGGELESRSPKLAAKLELSRFWVDW